MQIKKANKNEQQVHQRIKQPTVFNKHNGFFCLVSVNSEGPGKLGLKRRNFAPTTRGKVHSIPYNLLEK